METIESLEIQKEETDRYKEKLETARQKYIQYGSIAETDLPIDDSIDFRKMVLEFLEGKIGIADFLQAEIESSLTFYEQNGN